MGNGQVHNLSDLCCAMKEFGKRTSQASANGSFVTNGTLADFSHALVLLSEEVMILRSQLSELKSRFKNGELRKPTSAGKTPMVQRKASSRPRQPR